MKIEHSFAGWAVSHLVLAVVVSLGCGTTHGDHLEHHVPEHRPHDLADALVEIDKRWPALEAKWPTLLRQDSNELSELLDIVRWLPELAGDSDLPEAEWNKVNEVSKAWEARLVKLVSPKAQQNFPRWSEESSRLAELRRLAPLAATGHTHSHHGHSHD